ncbi:hypothetical protein LMG28727_07543 [Paraburkholderia kirstenboschensis]|nr:hypothetical protein LMG28727_07543 [Paraburkholderia kirstenboschensis]
MGGAARPYPAWAPVIVRSPMSTTVEANYQLFIDCVKARHGFVSEAEQLARTAYYDSASLLSQGIFRFSSAARVRSSSSAINVSSGSTVWYSAARILFGKLSSA